MLDHSKNGNILICKADFQVLMKVRDELGELEGGHAEILSGMLDPTCGGGLCGRFGDCVYSTIFRVG